MSKAIRKCPYMFRLSRFALSAAKIMAYNPPGIARPPDRLALGSPAPKLRRSHRDEKGLGFPAGGVFTDRFAANVVLRGRHEGSRPGGELGQSYVRNPECTGRPPAGSVRQVVLCDCAAVGVEGRVCVRRELWPRGHDLPTRREFQPTRLGAPDDDGPGRWKLRAANWRAGDRLCAAADERPQRERRVDEQGEA